MRKKKADSEYREETENCVELRENMQADF